MNFLLSIFYFALVMSILVFIHELGHFIAAKRFGVYCQEFAIGMGPTVFKYKKPNWETTFSIRALPFGGFVSMAGEPGEADMNVPFNRTIVGIARWKRLVIMLAGIFMNLVLAVVVFTGMFAAQGVVLTPEPIIAKVVEGLPADKAGLQDGDVITKLKFDDGTSMDVTKFEDLQVGVSIYQGKPLVVTVDRKGTSHTVTLTPELNAETNAYVIGVQAPDPVIKNVNVLEAIPLAFSKVWATISQMIFLITRIFRGIGVENLGGPVAIFGVTAEIANYGFMYFLNLVAILSVNLAVVNLIPIPIMDGGRVVITLVEMVIRRPLPEKFENAIMLGGAAIMLVFFIFVTFNDIMRLF